MESEPVECDGPRLGNDLVERFTSDGTTLTVAVAEFPAMSGGPVYCAEVETYTRR